MKVRMRIQIGGARNGQPWPPVGGVLECSEHEALSLIGNGSAELVPEEAVVEMAMMAPPENTALRIETPRRKPGRPRKVVFPTEG